jgi:hypothetical protein
MSGRRDPRAGRSPTGSVESWIADPIAGFFQEESLLETGPATQLICEAESQLVS